MSLLSFFEFLRLNVIISFDVSIITFPLIERLVFLVLSEVTRSVSSLLFHILCVLRISPMLIQLPEFGQWVFSLSLYEYLRLNVIMCGIVSIITFWLVEPFGLHFVVWSLDVSIIIIIPYIVHVNNFTNDTDAKILQLNSVRLWVIWTSELIIYKYWLNNPYVFLLVCYFVQFSLFNVIYRLHCIILYFVIHLLFVLCQTLLLHFTSVYFPCKFLKILMVENTLSSKVRWNKIVDKTAFYFVVCLLLFQFKTIKKLILPEFCSGSYTIAYTCWNLTNWWFE